MNEVKSPKKPLLYYYVVVLLVVMLFNFIAMPWISEHQIKDVDYNTFVTMTEQGEVGKVEIQQQDNRILFTSADEKTVYKTAMVPDDGLVQRLLDAGVSTTGTEIEQTSTLVSILAWVLPIVIFVALGQFMSRKMMEKMGGGNSMMFNMGKSNAKVYVKSAEGIRFSDVAGEDEAKENLAEVVNYLHDPSKYQEIGASMPKGILLVGPPGTGKTMLDLFKQAKEKAPCIVFIDEIDAIGQKRSGGQYGGNDEREQTLNQLLTEMDGFEGNTGVIILAATNRPESLDPALTRPGRFDRQVYVGLPDIRGREEILKIHVKNKPLAEDVDLSTVAKGTPGFTGADLENLSNEAALLAARRGSKLITMSDFSEAEIKVIAGPEKKSRVVSERARRLTAYHESGHAIASFFLKNADPVHYITIIPRGAAGGFTWYRKAEDAEDFTSRGEMFDSIVSALGGRIAEQLFLEDISTGASGDIQQATNIARDMVMKYGMSEKLGPISFDDSSHSIFIGRDFGTTKSYSEETAATIDEEVKHIFDQAYAKCEALLREHADLLTGLAEYLLIHETIEGDDFRYYCEHGVMPVHPDDTIEPPAKVIRRMDEAPEAPLPDTEPPAQPTDGAAPEDGSDKTE